MKHVIVWLSLLITAGLLLSCTSNSEKQIDIEGDDSESITADVEGHIAFYHRYHSEKDRQLFIDALSEKGYSELNTIDTADMCYNFLIRSLYYNQMDYPHIQKVSLVVAPEELGEENICEESAIKVVDTKDNTYILYFDNLMSLEGYRAMLYNDKVIWEFHARAE